MKTYNSEILKKSLENIRRMQAELALFAKDDPANAWTFHAAIESMEAVELVVAGYTANTAENAYDKDQAEFVWDTDMSEQ